MKNIKRSLFAVLCSGALMLSAAACSGSSSGDYPVNIGGTTFRSSPSSIVCLSDSVADILIACGYSDSVIAVSNECTQEEYSDLVNVGSKDTPDVKKIKNENPGIVFTDNTVPKEAQDSLKKEGIPVLNMITAANGDELTVLYESISAIMEGNNTGRSNGEKKVKNLMVTFDDLQRTVPEADVKPTACYLYDDQGTAATKAYFSGRFFDYANAINVCESSETSMGAVDSIKISNPDYIFCDIGVKEKLMKSSSFKSLKAVKNGKIREIDSKVFDRQGDSMTEVISTIIETIYPELESKSKTESSEASDKKESSKTENSKSESSKKENSKAESSKSESSKKEDSKTESSKAESSKTEVKADTSLEITDDSAYGQGDESEDVTKIQKRLKALGYFDEGSDGFTEFFGEKTAKAVIEFKKNNGLGTTESGEEVGPYLDADALRLMFSADAKPKA